MLKSKSGNALRVFAFALGCLLFGLAPAYAQDDDAPAAPSSQGHYLVPPPGAVPTPPEEDTDTEATTTPAPQPSAPVHAPAAPAPAAPSAAVAGDISAYVLGVGDKLRIKVFNEPDLTGDYEVSSTGILSMPLIGDVKAAQTTVSTLQSVINHKLSDGYMRNPHVSVEVLNYRPFFILGEVMKPGSYNYVNGMSVVTAVALAGGYTYRADKDDVTIKHGGQNAPAEKASETSTVMPGDVVNVPERFF